MTHPVHPGTSGAPLRRRSPAHGGIVVVVVMSVAGLCGCGRPGAEHAGGLGDVGPGDLVGRPSDGLLDRPDLQTLVEAGLDRDTPTLMRALTDGDPAVRSRAAYALASVEDTAARDALTRLLQDPEAHVRQDAAFALGQLGDPVDGPALLAALGVETDPRARVLLAEAVGKGGDQAALGGLLRQMEAGAANAETLVWVTALYHFGRRRITDPGAGDLLLRWVAQAGPTESELAALALAAPPSPASWGVTPEHVRTVLESLPRDRTAAGPLLELLGRRDDASSPAVLAAWLRESTEWRTRVAAARAARRSVASGAVDLRATLEEALEDPSIHVAVMAASVLAGVGMDSAQSNRWGAWIRTHLGRPSVAAAMLPGLTDPTRRELALAWARGDLGPEVPSFLAFPTLALLGRSDADALLLGAVEEDRRTTYAAAAALTARLRGGAPALQLRSALLPIVVRRASAWGPHAPMSDIRGLLGMVEALAEGNGPGRKEVLAVAARHGHPEMRKLAERLGAELPSAPPLLRQEVDWARLRAAGAHPRLRLEADEGDFVVELDAEAAPLSVSALLHWADAGAYSGLTFHRVEPAFVLQSGDFDAPGGYGGPDRGLRSEFTRIPYRPGTVGIASAGKDTEGSQYFATHGLSPSLDGRYSAVGWIVRGQSVADAAALGSPVHAVVPLGGEEGGP